MSEVSVKRGRRKTLGRFGGLVVLALSAVALLAPAEASAQPQIPPQPTGNDYCSDRSAPTGLFRAPNGGWSYLDIGFAGSPGSVGAALWGATADGCMRPTSQPVCSSNCRIEVQALCEFHCQHDHTPPYPWTVRLYPTAGHIVGWNATCVPAKDAPQSDCVVQMPAPGQATSALARFGPAPDAVPPAPFSASVSGVGSYTMTVSWTPSGDENWLGGYDIFNGGTKLLRVGPGTTTARLEALTCQTTYNIRVEAFDTRNRTPSNTVAATTGACIGSSDTRAPNTIFHVKPPKSTRSRTASFHWGANEASRYRCKLDRRVWTKCKLSDPYVLSMGKTYRRLKPGYHTFRVRAIDRAGNADPTPSVYRWRIRR